MTDNLKPFRGMMASVVMGLALWICIGVALGATPHPVQLCPVAAPGGNCPATATPVCGIPTQAADPVHVVNVGYVAYNAISASASVHDCTTNAWVAFSTTGIPLFSALPPPVPPAAPVTVAKTFSWTAPTQNTDGSPITGVLTYNVYLGGKILNTVPITQTSFGTQLAPGAYSVTATAVNAGIESAPSAALTLTIVTPAVLQPNPPTTVTSK